jgi:hypothetical protein
MMETFTQPKITGYRQLNEAEAALMNEIKAKGHEIEALIAKVRHRTGMNLYAQKEIIDRGETETVAEGDPPTAFQRAHAEKARLNRAEPERWAAIARTHFQEGLMALTRAVAQPSGF